MGPPTVRGRGRRGGGGTEAPRSAAGKEISSTAIYLLAEQKSNFRLEKQLTHHTH